MAKKKSIDPVVAINLLQSNMHKDIVQTVCANASSEKWNLSILIKADEIEAGELATNSFLKLLLQQLDNAFPERNKIKAQPGGAPSETAGKLRELAQSAFIKPLKGSCVESEMVLHSQMLRRAAVEHWARDHQCEQIMNFISRADSHSLPPFLVLGAPSMCKTALLGQVFVRLEQKYGVITSARPAPAARPSSAKSSFSAEVSASRPNTPAWSFPDGTLYMLDASPRKSVSRRGSSVPGPTPERPVIVARVIGVSPHSSTKTLLVRSMTHQILQAFGRTKAKWHQQGRAIESSAFFSPNNLDGWGDTAEHWLSPNGDDNILGRFKSALQLASSARPIIILIAHGERLSDPQFTQHQSLSSITITGPDKPTAPWLAWLLQDIPPFVRLVISANSRSPTAIVAQGIITRAAPEALEKAIKATGSEVPPSKSEIEAAVAANILEMGGLIAPVVRASVKNWLLIEGRKFTSEKIDALQAGFEAAESNSDSVVPGRMAKMLYDVMKQTKRDEWKNLQLPKTIEEAMDQTLENLEREIGREPIELLACLIAVSKHGLFVTELMDMVLNVQGAGAISRKDSQLLPLPSISSLAIFVAALHALNPWTQKQSIFGGELLAFDGAMDFKNAVFERYMAHSRDSSFVFRLRLAAYFENLMTRNDDSPSAGMPLAHLNRVQTELLFQLARCGQWSRLFKIVASLDFLLNLIVCKGPSGAVLELQDVISYGSTSSEITEPELTSLTQLSQWLSRLRYLLADLPPRLYRGLLEKLAQAESTGVGSDIKNDLKACQPTNEHLSTHHNWTPLTHSTSMIEAMKFTDYSSTSYIIPRNDPRIRKHPTTEHPILNFGIDFHTRPKATIVGIKENSELTPALQKRIHHNGVTFVAASCDGKIIATAGSRGVLRLFDSFTMSEIGTYTYVGGGSGRNTIQPSGNPALSPSTNCTPNVLPVMEISYLAFEPSKSKAGHLILSTSKLFRP
ncbi:hypothetical protein DFJ73DRAFT_227408 [Zopfochytrium polystomum]|nr:hypothetical protein DFJ73DRAFT_227408 [Zopfochytrium polystomum]